MILVFFYKQKTAYEMRISDWSSDVCSSDLVFVQLGVIHGLVVVLRAGALEEFVEHAFVHVGALPQIDRGQVKTEYFDGLLQAGKAQSRNRSEERRVGKGCVRTCRSRWLPEP